MTRLEGKDRTMVSAPRSAVGRGAAVGRRGFLLGGASLLFLSGCRATEGPTLANGAPVAASGVRYTVDDLLSSSPFYVAHRGSGDNWAEHTMDAYTNAVQMGVKAIEVSVNVTKDGVLVCHHDQTTKRFGSSAVEIATTDWSELSKVQIDARRWLGPAYQPQPIARLTDVLDAYAGTHVIFIEDKQAENTKTLLDLLDTYEDSTSHFVWKQWAGAKQYKEASKRGYRVWGYFSRNLIDRVDDFVANLDYLGVPAEATDDEVARLVATGKPVIAWEVHHRATRDRMAALGVRGMMCSNLPYVMSATARARADAFGSGLRAAGDLPWTTSRGVSYQPTFDVLTSSLSIGATGLQSYSMGSMCPVDATSYTIGFELQWPGDLPEGYRHAGIAFGQPDDRPYRVRVISEVSGYHLIIRANGMLELFSRPAGTLEGMAVGSVRTSRPVAGEWMQFTVEVTPEHIRVSRGGLSTWQFEVPDTSYRGGYFSLTKNYRKGPPVRFRSVTIS
jgi:glycerophosphoryl diester phosphodiesterase